jgi:hypothetical protein
MLGITTLEGWADAARAEHNREHMPVKNTPATAAQEREMTSATMMPASSQGERGNESRRFGVVA